MTTESEGLSTTVDPPRRVSLTRRPLVVALFVSYLVLWTWLAIRPLDRADWFLENLLVILALPILVWTRHRLPLSDVAYVVTALFLTLHAFGAHFTYSQVPFGFWLRDTFGLERNPYDRLVHFAFGALLAYPWREVLVRLSGARGFWSWYLPISGVLAVSGFFEIIEMLVVFVADPDTGAAYLGTQGDDWDAQKDMVMAVTGAALTMGLTALHERSRTRGS